MIETIRLIHNKDGDVEGIFLFEFFSLIGCIVNDYTVPDNEDLRSELSKDYELNLFIGISEQEIRTERKYHYLKLLIDELCDEGIYYVPSFRTASGELPQRRSAKSMLKAIVPKLYGRAEFKISFLAQRSQFLWPCILCYPCI